MNRKHLVAAAFLAVMAAVFGLAGMVASLSESSSSSPSDSLTNSMNPPTFDSGWVNITDKVGQYFTLTHNLNNTEIIVDITGKTTADGGIHQRNLGGTGYTPGWTRTYGGTYDDVAWSVIQTLDGGYTIAGGTTSFDAGGEDFWLVKTDAAGNMQWTKTYGGKNADYAWSVVETSDGGYAIAGTTYSLGAGYADFWLVKTDAAGNAEWNKTYGGKDADWASTVIETGDGGYAIAGHTYSFGAGNRDSWLVRIDAAGNMKWSRTYGGTDNEFARSVVETRDGGYAVAGSTYSFGAGDYDFWLVKTDSSGIVQWNQTYGGASEDRAQSVVQTSDGGYALVGYTSSFGAGNYDFWLIKTDAAGNAEWNQTYGGTSSDYGDSVIQTDDRGYALAGYTASFGAGASDFWLVKTDSNGNTQWNQTYGGTNDDNAYSVVEIRNGGYAVAGGTKSFGAGGSDFWLVKTGVESGLAWTNSTADSITLYRCETDAYWNYVRVRIWTIAAKVTISDVTDFPDPFRPSVGETSTISYKLSEKCHVKIRISDSEGRTVKLLRATQPAGANSMIWDGTMGNQGIIIPDGTYTYEIYATDMDGNELTPVTGTTTATS